MFRKKSLERLSSPERLDRLLHVADPKSWLPLAAIAVLVLGTLVWSIFAKVPVTVEGRGILIRPRKVVAFQAPGAGRLAQLNVRVGDMVAASQELATIDRPDLAGQLRLQRERLRDLTLQQETAEQLRLQRTLIEESSTNEQGQRLQEHIETSRALAKRLYDERLDAIGEQERRLAEQERIARKLADSTRDRLERYGGMEQDMFSEQELLRVEEEHMQSLSRLYEIESEQRGLRTDKLQADEDYIDRLQRIAEWTFQMQGLDVREKELAQENLASASDDEQGIADVRREITRLEALLSTEARIVSKQAGRILEISVVPGAYVRPGDRLGTMEVIDADSRLVSLTFFKVRDGKRIERGMSIRVTPDTVERARSGSIVGTVTRVAPFPVTVEYAESEVGNPVVAESLTSGGHLIEVFSDLTLSDTRPGQFQWSSARGADIAVTAGTTTTAHVAVERRRPIAFVFPLLRSTTGLD